MDYSYQTVLLWFSWPAVVGYLIYWYLTKDFDYWKKHGIPSVPAVAFFGSMYGVFDKPMQDTDVERCNQYGRIYGYFEGSRPALIVAEPELLRDILVKDFPSFSNRRRVTVGEPINDNMLTVLDGEDWKRVRTLITPTFTTGKIKRMLNIFTDCAKTLCQNFATAAKDGKFVDTKVLFGTFTMDVIASSAFSTKIDSHNSPSNKFVITARKFFSKGLSWRFVLFFLAPSVSKFFRLSLFPPEAMEFFKTVTIQIIQERKRTGQVRNDFLQLMMDTAKEGLDKELEAAEAEKNENEEIDRNYDTEDNNDIFKQYLKKKTLSYDEMVSQCVIFFLGGYDTAASTLSFVVYNLALHPEIQVRLIKEIDEAVADSGGKITYEAIQSMKYLDNVISETLRLYPPAVRLERRAEEDYKLGNMKIPIRKDMIIGVPIYAMHKDPEFFPDPEKFDPDRFTPEERAKRSPYSFLPFGAGPRNCIGMRFALMEIKVCLAYVLSQFRIRRCPETKVPLEFNRGAGLLAPKEVTLKMEIRNDVVLKVDKI